MDTDEPSIRTNTGAPHSGQAAETIHPALLEDSLNLQIFEPPRSNSITFANGVGMLLCFHSDGRVEAGENLNPTEAADQIIMALTPALERAGWVQRKINGEDGK